MMDPGDVDDSRYGNLHYQLPPESWTGYRDYNPDRQRSTSRMYVEDRGRDLVWMLGVRGLGAILLRAGSDPETGRLEFYGVSTFTDAEIGHRQ